HKSGCAYQLARVDIAKASRIPKRICTHHHRVTFIEGVEHELATAMRDADTGIRAKQDPERDAAPRGFEQRRRAGRQERGTRCHWLDQVQLPCECCCESIARNLACALRQLPFHHRDARARIQDPAVIALAIPERGDQRGQPIPRCRVRGTACSAP
ncbi:hypothetical protein CCACVL1_01414, partial [Corchorus capsularis]